MEGSTKFGRSAPVLLSMCRIVLYCFAVKEAHAGGLVRLSNGRASECSIRTITESSPRLSHRLRVWWAAIGPFLATQKLSVWSRHTRISTTSCGQEIVQLMRTWPTCDITGFRLRCSTGADHHTSRRILRLRTPARTATGGYPYSFSANATSRSQEIRWTCYTSSAHMSKHTGDTSCSRANTRFA